MEHYLFLLSQLISITCSSKKSKLTVSPMMQLLWVKLLLSFSSIKTKNQRKMLKKLLIFTSTTRLITIIWSSIQFSRDQNMQRHSESLRSLKELLFQLRKLRLRRITTRFKLLQLMLWSIISTNSTISGLAQFHLKIKVYLPRGHSLVPKWH